MTMKAGQLITDGNAVWIVDDVRDGARVGDIILRPTLRDGYIKANGATVQRSDYPRLVTLVDKHNLWTDDVTANAGLFGHGDGAATMVLPNWTDRMVQMPMDSAGASVAAGLPNITGIALSYGVTRANTSHPEGAFMHGDQSIGYLTGETNTKTNKLAFDASKSNPIYGGSTTVQPSAIKLIPIIRY